MYTVAVIFLAILVLVIYFYLRSRREKRRMEIWVASQPPEVVISGRQKAVERARALLQEQNDCKAFFVDCKDFFYEFEQSQDPKIRELADTVEGFAHESDEFRGLVESLIIDLESTQESTQVCSVGNKTLRKFDVVEVVTLLTEHRSIDGTKTVMRQPRVGDEGTIVYILKDSGTDSQYVVESVDQSGMTVWLAEFHHSELKLKVRPKWKCR